MFFLAAALPAWAIEAGELTGAYHDSASTEIRQDYDTDTTLSIQASPESIVRENRNDAELDTYGTANTPTSVVEEGPQAGGGGGGAGGAKGGLGDSITPFLNVSLSYDDNVRLRQNPRADAYLTISPGFRAQLGRPQNRLTVNGRMNYSHYFRLKEYTQIEGGSLGASYVREPSPNWHWEVSDYFNSTYDSAVVTEEGNLIRVQPGEGRQDQNTFRVSVEHTASKRDSAFARYWHFYNTGTQEDYEDSQGHRLNLGFSRKLAAKWQGDAQLTAGRDIYSRSADANRMTVDATLSHYIGPSREVFLTLGYNISRPVDDNAPSANDRDYTVFTASLGHSWAVSPTFSWGASVGWSQVEGQVQDVSRGGGDPIFSIWVRTSGKRWQFNARVESRFVDYNFAGDVSGLSYSHRGGMSFSYELARHWRLNMVADYIMDDFSNREITLVNQNTGKVNTLHLGASLWWQFSRYSTLMLDYRHLDRDAENDNDDRSQNRIMLILNLQYPFGW